MEVSKKVKPILIVYACDDCITIPNKGCILKHTGQNWLANPITFDYICPNCKKEYQFNIKYPEIRYEEITD